MNDGPVDFDSEDCDALQAFLAERVYEFNALAIGRFNGKLLGAAIRSATGEIIAAISGHTWAGCCQVTYLWVGAEHRGSGFGRRLLRAAEAEAKRRGCANLIVSSHSFQAPWFYEHLGYKRHAVVLDHPVGHSNIFFVKALADNAPNPSLQPTRYGWLREPPQAAELNVRPHRYSAEAIQESPHHRA